MANCEDIKDKNSQEYKDCLENNKKTKVETPATIGTVGQLESVDVTADVDITNRSTLAIKLGTKLNEISTYTSETKWNPTVKNIFNITDESDLRIEEKYSKYKDGALGQMAREAPDLYEEFEAIRLSVENSGKYDKVGDYDKRKKEIRKDARAQFNIILDLKTETDLKEALTDKVYAIYKAADFNPENVTEASLLDPETFNEEEIKNNKILINKGLQEYKDRAASGIISKFRIDNDIAGVGGDDELTRGDILIGYEPNFFGDGDYNKDGMLPNQAARNHNIKVAKDLAIKKGTYAEDEIRLMLKGDAKYFSAINEKYFSDKDENGELIEEGFRQYSTLASINNSMEGVVNDIEAGREAINAESKLLQETASKMNNNIEKVIKKRNDYLKFYNSKSNQKLLKETLPGFEYSADIANVQLKEYNDEINNLINDYNAENFNDQVIALNIQNDKLNDKAIALKLKAEKYSDMVSIMGAASLNHNAIDKGIAVLEREFIGSPYTLWTQAKGLAYDFLAATAVMGDSVLNDETRQKNEQYYKDQANLARTAGINYYTFLQDKQAQFVKGPTIEEVKNDDDFYFQSGALFKSWTADAALTLSAVLGPSKIASFVSKGLIKNMARQGLKGKAGKLVAADINKSLMTMANRTTMGIFFSSSAGGQLGQGEYIRSIADKKIIDINKALKNEKLSFVEKQNLLNELNTYTDSKNNSRAFRIFNSIGYGFVEMYAEKFGTLRYMNDFNAARNVAEAAGKLNLWQKGLYGGYYLGKNITTEVVEETITEVAHAGLDNAGRAKKISVFSGIDTDFIGNVAFTSLLLQGPTKITNIWNTLKQEITTKEDRAATEKIFGRLYDLQLDFELELKTPGSFTKQELQDKKNERDNLFQVGSINEFLSMQKWTKMSKLDRDKLIDLGGKLKTVEAAYVKFIQDPLFGVEGFQQQVEQFENEINDLREQQGELLQSKSFKEYQKWQTLDIEAGNAGVEGVAGTGIKVSAVVASGRLKVFNAANDILKHQFGGTTTSIEADKTGKNLQNFITEYNEKNKNKVDKEGNKIEPLTIEEIENSYAGVLPNGNVYINKSNIYRAIQNGTTNDALIAAIAPLHELIHLQIAKKNIFGRSKELTQKAEIASAGLLNIIDDKVNKEQLTPERAKEIKDRIESYKLDGKLNFEEINTIFGEAIILGNIKQSDFAGLSGMKEFLNGMFSMMNPGGASEILNPFNSGADMYNFLSNFVDKQADVSTRIVTTDTEKEELGSLKPSLVPVPGDLKSQFDNEFVIEGDTYSTKLENEDGERKFNSKEDFKNSVEKTNLQMLIELTPTLDGSIRNLPGVSQAYLDMQGNETYIEDVKKRISDKAMSEFNPALNESFFGWLTGKNVSGKSIIELAAGDIQM